MFTLIHLTKGKWLFDCKGPWSGRACKPECTNVSKLWNARAGNGILLEGVERGAAPLQRYGRVFWRGPALSFRVSCAASRRFFHWHLHTLGSSSVGGGFVPWVSSQIGNARCAQAHHRTFLTLDQQANHFPWLPERLPLVLYCSIHKLRVVRCRAQGSPGCGFARAMVVHCQRQLVVLGLKHSNRSVWNIGPLTVPIEKLWVLR